MPVTTETRGGRRYAATGTKWESIVGYSRAVRAGRHIAVTGTIGLAADGSLPPDASGQTRESLRIVVEAIEALGGRVSDVIRTRMFVTDIGRFEDYGREHARVFGDVRPATTMVEVSKLALDDALIEIEADAYVAE